jgi:hypothetical protein
VTTTGSVATVVIPAYRAADFLQRAVGSVLDQTMHDWELVVVPMTTRTTGHGGATSAAR